MKLTIREDAVVAQLKQMAVFWMVVPHEVVAIEGTDNPHHRVKVGVSHAIGKNKAPKNLRRIKGIVDVDVALKCVIRHVRCRMSVLWGDKNN